MYNIYAYTDAPYIILVMKMIEKLFFPEKIANRILASARRYFIVGLLVINLKSDQMMFGLPGLHSDYACSCSEQPEHLGTQWII